MAVTQSTKDVIRFGAAADSVAGLAAGGRMYYVQKVMWVGPTTDAHKLVLSDAAGTVLLEYKANTAQIGTTIDIDYHIKSARFDGIVVTTMDSGKVDVYLE